MTALAGLITPGVIITVVVIFAGLFLFMMLARFMFWLTERFQRGKPLEKLLVLIPLLIVGAVVLTIDAGFTIIIAVTIFGLAANAKKWLRTK